MSETGSPDVVSSISMDDAVAVESAETGASRNNTDRGRCPVPEIPKHKVKGARAELLGVGVSVPDNGLGRIRARASYRLFRELYEFLKDKPDAAAVLRKFYEVLDARGGFGSRQNAGYAAESLGQVLNDVQDADSRQEREGL
jgi:hypothetical protein